DVVIKEGSAVSDGGTFTGDDVYLDCLIKVVGGQYGRTIKVTINGKTFSYKCPPGIAPATYAKEVTGKIYDKDGNPIGDITTTVQQNDGSTLAAQMPSWTDGQFIIDNGAQGPNVINGFAYPDSGLAFKMRAAGTGLGAGWVVETGPGWIHVKSPAGTPITELRVDDGYANQIASALVHQVTAVAKLPIEAPNGYKIQVTGDTTKSGDKYYVQYDARDKVWKEAVGWNITKGLDSATMPHALVRKADGSFVFTAIDGTVDLGGGQKIQTWAERTAGDDDTNPQPSFVGGRFNDVFMFRNRLGLLAGENIILSRTSHYLNFYPASVANESDDDPIDVAVSHNRISVLKYAVPFSEQLLLWSDQAQFVLNATGILSSKTMEL
ncbi:phage nozzle protein, partial [Herbiconiux daphne]